MRKATYYDVFLAAAEADGEIAATVQSVLESAGQRVYPVWRQPSAKLKEDAVRKALVSSRTLVAIVTKAAQEAPLIEFLIAAAWALRKPVYILLHGLHAEALNVSLCRFRIDHLSKLPEVVNEIGRGARGKTA